MAKKTKTVYRAEEYTSNPTKARAFFRNRKIKGAKIKKITKTNGGSYVYFTKPKTKRKSRRSNDLFDIGF